MTNKHLEPILLTKKIFLFLLPSNEEWSPHNWGTCQN
uniref:Uncharacterized protein n=1 Tax=Nelumbo nucifera TaxID=4432 RepID=A0A822YIQ7_NELNU|nr:TPA_asm: hypothetical protein HUJ06_010232 [Nelumbo nucifera]